MLHLLIETFVLFLIFLETNCQQLRSSIHLARVRCHRDASLYDNPQNNTVRGSCEIPCLSFFFFTKILVENITIFLEENVFSHVAANWPHLRWDHVLSDVHLYSASFSLKSSLCSFWHPSKTSEIDRLSCFTVASGFSHVERFMSSCPVHGKYPVPTYCCVTEDDIPNEVSRLAIVSSCSSVRLPQYKTYRPKERNSS